MAFSLFGYTFGRDEGSDSVRSFATPEKTETSIDVAALDAFTSPIGHYLDLDGTSKSENKLIEKYREISGIPEVDQAIEEIVGDAIVSDKLRNPVSINLDKVDISDNIKNKVHESFSHIMGLLHFNNRGHDIFRRWYIDGRINYHKMIDEENLKKGIVELRFIDPKKIKKVREFIKKTGSAEEIFSSKNIKEYYIYNPMGVDNVNESSSNRGMSKTMKIAKHAIAHGNSGKLEHSTGVILSHLHKAIRPATNLRMMEDSLIIYRLSRAPERRIFYIDVGNLPKGRAEQYMTQIQNKYKNKLVYDVNTGEIRDDRRHLAMTEDYWLPRREGSRGTEISTLQGGQQLGEVRDVEVFKEKLLKALNVPVSRFSEESNVFGRGTEITRDELKFSKFITRLRSRFTLLFDDLLGTDLVLKGVMSWNEWNDMKTHVFYDFIEDNYFSEMFEVDVLQSRLNLARDAIEYQGTFFSKKWIAKNIFRMTEKELNDMNKEIEQEKKEAEEGNEETEDGDQGTDSPFGR